MKLITGSQVHCIIHREKRERNVGVTAFGIGTDRYVRDINIKDTRDSSHIRNYLRKL